MAAPYAVQGHLRLLPASLLQSVVKIAERRSAVRRSFNLPHAATTAQAPKVVTTVEEPGDLATLRYWQQGDEALYSLDNVQRRYQNRFHPDLVELMKQRWWPVALRAVPIAGWDGLSLIHI